MFSAFSTALSGLDAQATAIDVVGNNLANLNTPGYKASTCAFQDMMTQVMGAGTGAGETQIGMGVGRPVTLRQFSQGTIQTTSGNLDAAINGDGFFVVRDAAGSQLYTRAGNLKVDKDGNLTTATGENVQGWTSANGAVDTTGSIGNITLPAGALHGPAATKNASVDLNLNAAAQAGSADGTFSTTMDVFDSLGVSHSLTFNFTKSATANQWDYSVSVPDGDLKNAFTPVTGTLTFAADGTLSTPAQTDPPVDIAIPGLADGAADMDVKWSLYDGLASRITQYSQASSPSAQAQDGWAAANLLKVSIGNGGQIVAQYSNQQQAVVGQIAMALVRNPDSLVAVGNNNYAVSGNTAAPAIGLPGTGGRGGVVGGAIEASTADIAREFTNLIVYQRAYEANAKVVTTTDQMSQDTINLKQ
jgi:flagellar hook protein FlgE